MTGGNLMDDVRLRTRLGTIAMLLVGAAMVLGGGGSPAPLPELLLQLIAVFLVGCWIVLSPPVTAPSVPKQAWLIAGLILLLPLVQLIPLPPAVWHALPGRSGERAALALVGAENSWQPWSVAPSRTLAAFLALGVPAAVLVMTASLGRSGRNMVMGMIAAAAFASLLVGTGQLTGGEANTLRYYVKDAGYLNGFQANHNSAADVLLIGMVAFVGVVCEWSARRARPLTPAFLLGISAGGTVLFSLGVFLTASRAGMALLPVAWLGILLILWPWLRFTRRALLLSVSVGVIAAMVLAWALLSSGTAAKVVSRFSFEGEFRPQLWRDALYAAQQYFPFGSGTGTFVPVFTAIERLEVVDPTMPNRAHNDYLELLIESGLFGVVVLTIVGGIIARRLVAVWRDPARFGRAQASFASASIAVVALHSQVDYPLRSMSLACIAAAAAGLLMPSVEVSRNRRSNA